MARTEGAHTRVFRRLPRARDRAWQSIRILRQFTLADLVATAEIGRDNARKFVLGLRRAGYVREVREKRNGHRGGYAIYRLTRDTGPHAPRMQSDGRTYDTNQHIAHAGGVRQ
jgi:DNA-binding IscR family transcriptional regulator